MSDLYSEYNPPPRKIHYGNETNTNRLVWWILAIVSAAGLAEASWLGNAVIELKSEVAALNAKVDFIIPNYKKQPHE